MPSITITLSPEDANRVSVAYQYFLALPAPATVADVKTALVAQLKGAVRQYEKASAETAAVASLPAEIAPT